MVLLPYYFELLIQLDIFTESLPGGERDTVTAAESEVSIRPIYHA
jgi:hypothetical protein